MKKTIINGKRYTVSYVFNMVGNWYFEDKDGRVFLVDGEDVGVWAQEKGLELKGVDTAIAYAKETAEECDGVFWWKEKTANPI